MPEVSIETVGRLLSARGADPRLDDDGLLAAARAERNKLAATLLSLWEREGRVLTPAWRAELAAHRERLEIYRGTWDALSKAAPDAFLLKGASIAAFYPPGVLRSAGDLDVVCTTSDDLWSAAHLLLGDGWEVSAFTVLAARPGDTVVEQISAELAPPCNLLLEITRPGPDPAGDELAVGLTTAEIVTVTSRPPYQLARQPRSPLAANLVALTAELWERDYRSRDLLDLALLVERLTAADLDALRDGLTRTGLWPEWQTLTEAVAELGWPLPVVLPETFGAAFRERMARRVRATVRWSNPVRALAYAAQFGVERESALADRASDLLHERVGAYRALALGLPLFGVPIGCSGQSTASAPNASNASRAPDTSGLEIVRIGRNLVALSPVGTYLLAAGACRQEWIDEVVDGIR